MKSLSSFQRVGLAFVSFGLAHRSIAQTHTKPDAAAVATLIAQGEDAFASGKMDEAYDAFSKAFSADSSNVQAARDLGIVYLRTDKLHEAEHPLDVASRGKSPDRPTVLALAYQFIALKSPMQGVKPVLAYLNGHSGVPDETVLNAMGIALAAADAKGINSSFFTDSQKAYKKLNAKLEATRKGEKRWGTDWLPADEVDKKQATVDAARLTVKTNLSTIQNATQQIANLQQLKDAVPYTEGDNNMTKKKAAYQKQIDDANARCTQANKDIDDARKVLTDTLPKWPENLAVESLTLTTDTTDASKK